MFDVPFCRMFGSPHPSAGKPATQAMIACGLVCTLHVAATLASVATSN